MSSQDSSVRSQRFSKVCNVQAEGAAQRGVRQEIELGLTTNPADGIARQRPWVPLGLHAHLLCTRLWPASPPT